MFAYYLMMWYYNYRCVQTNVLHWEVHKMTNEEYIRLINKLLVKFNNKTLKRIYSYLDDLLVGRGD